MKTKLLFVSILLGFSMCAFAQMKVSGGYVVIGSYGEETYFNADVSLYSKMTSGATRISFNSMANSEQQALDVFVGKYPSYTAGYKPKRLHLHGKDGFVITSLGGDLMHAVDSAVYFDVDAIGTFYTPSDSRFKENVQPLRNALSGLRELSGISYQLKNTQVATPASVNSEATTDNFTLAHRANIPVNG